jgi:diphthamide synthase (EF-2-diphthine--ammonia ligase)
VSIVDQSLRMTHEEGFAAAIVAFRAQGLAPSSFGLQLRNKVIQGEIASAETIARIKKFNEGRGTASVS